MEIEQVKFAHFIYSIFTCMQIYVIIKSHFPFCSCFDDSLISKTLARSQLGKLPAKTNQSILPAEKTEVVFL